MPDQNSDDPAVRDEELAKGEAGLYFAEALAMKMIEMKVLTAEQVIEALDLAKSTKDAAAEEGQASRISSRAAAVLAQVMNSISALQKLPQR